ncbi:MAG: CoA transferase [Candidatus Rokubacteria bacterium]|nr:CoA transferase [Candidatus Rokubacteria bacterium]
MKRALLLPGIRVIDLSTAYAGPYAGKLLGDLGADVIHVETAERLDIMRNYPPYLADDGLDRSGTFASLNRNKRGITLNLKRAGARRVMERLVQSADVLLENYTPRVLPSLGFPWARLAELNPRLVYCTMPGFGIEGPHRDYRSYGPTLEGQSGIAAMTGYEDEPPLRMGCSYPDMVGGVTAAFAILAALRQRTRTGRGAMVEVPQQQAAAALTGIALGEWTLNKRLQGRMGNAHPWFVPHNVYRCAGDDRWIAIVVRDDAAWARLGALVDLPPMEGGERRLRRAEIDAAVARWTATRDADAAFAELRALGVEASPVRRALDLVDDPHLAARGFVEPVGHPVVGPRPYAGPPWQLLGVPTAEHAPAPCLGEHTERLLAGLGFPPDEIARLGDEGALA